MDRWRPLILRAGIAGGVVLVGVCVIVLARAFRGNGEAPPDGPPWLTLVVKPGRGVSVRPWRYVIIHHSATRKGNAASFDRYHRRVRKWEHGLAYHFVIGNGTWSGDGEIEIGRRWEEQLDGGHTSDARMNREAIGVCLVGNFEERAPTEAQMASLATLVTYLRDLCQIPVENVIPHSAAQKRSTVCPGKLFPWTELRARLASPPPSADRAGQ